MSRPETTSPTVRPDGLPSADPQRVVGQYVLARRIGEGAIGEVWRAWDTKLRRWVALKFLKSQDAEELARFDREAQTAGHLSHPNIAAVYEVAEAAGRRFIAMQYVGGPTLGAFPRRDPRVLVELVRDAALAVQHAHENGVIHRDLKPENIMVETRARRPRVYVMDFGLAKPTRLGSSLSMNGMIIGTPNYMSPEQARGNLDDVDERSDVFSLGATLYDLLTGGPPFAGKQVYETLRRVIEEEPVAPRTLNPRINRDLATIAMRCLEKNPARRYPSALALAEDLTRWLADEAIVAHPPSTGYRIRKFVGRRLALLAVAAAGLLAVAATLGALVPRWLAEKREAEARRREVEEARRREETLRDIGSLWSEIVVTREWVRQSFRTPDEIRRRLTGAVERVSDYVSRHPEQAQGYYVRARARLYLRDLDAAERDLCEAIRIVPDFAPGWALLGQVRLERYTRALYAWGPATAIPLERAQRLLKQAEEALRRGQDGSIERWGLAPTPEDRVSRIVAKALHESYVTLRYEAGMEILRRAHAEAPSEEYCWWLGALSRTPEEKLLWYDRAIRIAPHDARAWLDRAMLRASKGDIPGGIEDCTRSIAIDPANPMAWTNRGSLRRAAGDLDGAIDDHTNALSLGPDLAGAWYNRALARGARGDVDGCIADFTKAIELEPGDAEAWCERGVERSKKGDLDGEIADYTRAIEINPRHAKAYYNRAIAREDRRDFEGAIDDYTRAIEADPRHASSHYNRALLRWRRKDVSGAVADLKRARDLSEAGSDERSRAEEFLRRLSK